MPFEELLGDDLDGDGGEMLSTRIRDNRESDFDLEVGQFRNPSSGRFELGRAPPDYGHDAKRFRANDGQFKDRSADLFDEPAEVMSDTLDPEG